MLWKSAISSGVLSSSVGVCCPVGVVAVGWRDRASLRKWTVERGRFSWHIMGELERQ